MLLCKWGGMWGMIKCGTDVYIIIDDRKKNSGKICITRVDFLDYDSFGISAASSLGSKIFE